MRILLLGYGKMGKAIEKIALDRGHEIAGTIDAENFTAIASSNADVAIEFSQPEAAFNNIKACLENNIPVACGTTGWLNRKNEVDALTKKFNGTFFYASNYSVGVNILFRLNRQLAAMMKTFNEYRASIDETHHAEKKDAPSGTAITLAEGLIAEGIGKTWTKQATESKDDIAINSFRVDEVPGTHIVKYSSVIDDLEIRHIAHSREGFARGAVMVAEWLPGKKGVLGMDDFLKF